ncbi:SAP domain-containing protein [Nitrosococcus halophilus]|nr:SAP domain-containing protein [Nitrosococcus halophilus]
MNAILSIARLLSIPNPGLNKVELVRCIQRAEGNIDCFARAREGDCHQYGCLWREECLPLSRSGGGA